MDDNQTFVEDVIRTVEEKNFNSKVFAHYTKVDAFLSIIGSLSQEGGQSYFNFWFTDAFCTNDPEELSLGYDFVIKSFSLIENCLYKKEDRYLVTNYEDELKRSQAFRNVDPAYIKNYFINKEATPYIMSLSRNIDNLDMWLKTYGNGGDGVCLLFDFTEMNKYRYQADFFVHGPFSVIYGDKVGYCKEKNMLQNAVWSEYVHYMKDIQDIDDFDTILCRKIKAIDEVCSIISSFIKHEDWSGECEERMVALRHFIPVKEKLNVITSSSGKKHIDIQIPLTCLKKIIIGPCVDEEYAIKVKESASSINISSENVVRSKTLLRK